MLEQSFGLTFFLKTPKKRINLRYVYLRITVDGVFGYGRILRTAVYRLCLYTNVQAEIAALGRRSFVRQVVSGQIVVQSVAYIG